MQRQGRPVEAKAPSQPQGHGRVAMLPFTKVHLGAGRRSAKPPETLGEHLKAVRTKRGLTQKAVAAMLSVNPVTLLHWEKGTVPPIASIPAILAFLGYDPEPAPTTLSERMRHFRRTQGLSINAAAKRVGCDEESWAKCEKGRGIPTKAVREFFGE